MISSPAFKALISIIYPGACIQVLLPAFVLDFIIQIICDHPLLLTTDIVNFFAEGEPSRATQLNALCHLYEISSGYQIPKLARHVNQRLPSNAWLHPALAFAEAMQQVPYHRKLAAAALRCFDIKLADMCNFHFWRRISFTQSLKIHQVLFNEYEWQRSTHMRFILVVYSERHRSNINDDPLAGVQWEKIANRFLDSMRFEPSEIPRANAAESSTKGPAGTAARL